MKLVHTMNRTRYSTGQVPVQTQPGYDVLICIQVHIPMSVPGGFFPEIQGPGLSILHSNHRKSSTSQIARTGVGDRQGKLYGYSRINGIASTGQDVTADFGGNWVGADDHV